MRFGERYREDSGYDPSTTNNRMELRAVIEALAFLSTQKRAALESGQEQQPGSKRSPSWLQAPITVFTDSTYVKNGITQWISGWKARGWRTADKKPVKNQDLWTELDMLVMDLSPSFQWVEGHAGEPDNEQCDLLVKQKVAAMKGAR